MPAALQYLIRNGIRAKVQFGRSQRYSTIVVSISEEAPGYRTKSVLSIIDE